MAFRRLRWGLFFWLLTGSILGSPWRFSNPQPHGNHIYDMAFRDRVVWQVGDRGRLYTSPDLDQWMPHETGTTRSLRGIAFLDANAFICGEAGTILAGPAPGQLRSQSVQTTNWLEAVAASPTTLVAVGDNGAIYSSTGNGTWTRRGSFDTWLRGIDYGNGQFLCVGEDGFIASSADGQSWERLDSGTTFHLNRVAWLNGSFWVLGDRGTVLTNDSSMTFRRVDVGVTNELFTISGNANEVVIAGDSVVLLRSSPDGEWTEQADAADPNLAPVWPYYSSLWDGRLFLLGGRSGMIVEGFRTNSTASLVWYSDIQPTRAWLWNMTRVGDLYAAVGAQGTIVTSEDGLEWAREVVPLAAQNRVLLGIGGDTNVLIAAGTGGTLLRSESSLTNVISTNSTGQIVTNLLSLLGLRWDLVPVTITDDLHGVAFNEGTFLVTGATGTILSSTDGSLWLPRLSGVTNYLSGITASPRGYVAVGTDGVILTSTDTLLWTRRDSGVRDWIYTVRWAGNKLIAVGENGLILTSDDGIDWTRRQSQTTEWLNDVTFTGGTWYIAGSGGTIVTSNDSVSWTPESAITSNSLYSGASDGNQLILTGMEGTILRKFIETPASPVNIIGFEHIGINSVFLFAGQIDQQFVLEESTSITGPWTFVASLELTEAPGTLIYEYADDDAATKFFRTRLVTSP